MSAVEEFAALSPMRRVLMLADRLVADAEREGITVRHVSLFGDPGFPTITLLLDDDELTPALALALGLPRYEVYRVERGMHREVFRASIGDVEVTTFHDVPASVAAVTR